MRSGRFGKGSRSGPRAATTKTVQKCIGGGIGHEVMEGLTAVHYILPFTDKNHMGPDTM